MKTKYTYTIIEVSTIKEVKKLEKKLNIFLEGKITTKEIAKYMDTLINRIRCGYQPVFVYHNRLGYVILSHKNTVLSSEYLKSLYGGFKTIYDTNLFSSEISYTKKKILP